MKPLVFSGQALRLAGALALIGGPVGAWAQTPAAAPAAAPNPNIPTYGPPLAGVCVFARDTALNTSQAGAAANQQLQQMAQSVQATLNPERDAIAKDSQTLATEKPKLTAAVYAKREQALQQRAATYSQTVQTRNAQFQQSRDKAMDQIAAAVTPILVSTITAHQCSLIVERGGIYGANPAMDLTTEVITKLNAVLPSVTVTLAPPPVPGQPAG